MVMDGKGTILSNSLWFAKGGEFVIHLVHKRPTLRRETGTPKRSTEAAAVSFFDTRGLRDLEGQDTSSSSRRGTLAQLYRGLAKTLTHNITRWWPRKKAPSGD